MRNRLIFPVLVILLVAGAAAYVLSRRGETAPAASPAASGGLSVRTVKAGSVEVRIEPVRVDGSGALFRVFLDTHEGDLGVDLARTATLRVNGADWGNPVWNGDPPGGHHRQGELSFPPGGPASGDVRLTIEGLPGPVVADWNLRTG